MLADHLRHCRPLRLRDCAELGGQANRLAFGQAPEQVGQGRVNDLLPATRRNRHLVNTDELVRWAVLCGSDVTLSFVCPVFPGLFPLQR
jgi:hypothetical protein